MAHSAVGEARLRMAEDITMKNTNTTMNPNATARRRLCTTLAAVSLLAALTAVASLEAAQIRRPPSSRIAPPVAADARAANTFALLWQFGVPQPPEAYVPPEIVHEFWTLLGTFERYGIRAGFTFPEWIVRNGVTDPWEQHRADLPLLRLPLPDARHVRARLHAFDVPSVISASSIEKSSP